MDPLIKANSRGSRVGSVGRIVRGLKAVATSETPLSPAAAKAVPIEIEVSQVDPTTLDSSESTGTTVTDPKLGGACTGSKTRSG